MTAVVMIEAVVLSSLGGLIGIVLATGASIGLAAVMEVPYLFNPAVNLLSFVFSAGIGVLFGYFPARRAARLDPIEARRHEEFKQNWPLAPVEYAQAATISIASLPPPGGRSHAPG